LLRIYLDQNKWIDLARAATGHLNGVKFVEALAAARAAVESGAATFPLDIYRYLETGRRGNKQSRIELADFMFELSRQQTMARPHILLPTELDKTLKYRFGRPAFPRPNDVFGVGMTHIFAGEVTPPAFDPKRLPSGKEFTSDEQLAALDRAYNRVVEEEMLRMGPDAARKAGFDPSDRELDDRFVSYEESIASEIRSRNLRGDMLELAVRASDLGGIRSAVTEALERIGMTWDGFTDGISPAQLMGFMGSLPTRYVTNVMRAAKLRQSEQRWERNDFNDIAALPVAAVYCDVVVTEKQWVHHLNQGGVDVRFATTLLSDTAKLADLLG
jgi:hypothetical protein